jgi:hypothetical protein
LHAKQVFAGKQHRIDMIGQEVTNRVRVALQSRHIPIVLAIAAVVLSLPTLNEGLLFDDLWHWAELARPSELDERLSEVGIDPNKSGKLSTAISELFVVVSPDKNLHQLMQYGALPWWTYERLKVAAWRPLSSFTHWLDYRVFGGSEMIMHAHSIVWFAAAIALLAMLYRSLIMPGWVAGLAAVLYLLSDSSYFPTLWISSRNLLLSLFFGLATLLAHHRWREQRSAIAAVIAVSCLFCSLLSAEAGLATFAYLVAYAVMLERTNWARRFLSLAPAIAVVLLWRAAYNLQGYGAYGGELYIDPVQEPLRFVLAALQRGPFLLAGQLSSVPADAFSYLSESAKTVCLPVALGFTALVLIAFIPLLRKDQVARFWFAGTLLSIVPICAIIPMSRNLLFVGIGAFGLVAQFVGGMLSKQSWIPSSRSWRAVAWIICIFLVLAHLPVAAARRVTAPFTSSAITDEIMSTMQLDLPPESEKQDIVVVNAPYPIGFQYIPFLKAYEKEPLPRTIRLLAPGFGPLQISRTDNKTVVLRAQLGNLLSHQEGDFLHLVYFYRYIGAVRDAGQPMQAGYRIELPRMCVNVLEVDDNGLPTAAKFTFEDSLDNTSLRWLMWDWDKDRYIPFDVPTIGEEIYVPGPF